MQVSECTQQYEKSIFIRSQLFFFTRYSGFGAAFDGWIDVTSKVDDLRDTANNQAWLEVGDRLAALDGKDLLEATFSEIRTILHESTTLVDADKFRRRNLVFIKPAKRRVLKIDEDCQSLDVWLQPINEVSQSYSFSKRDH
uniref:PDZ domain-containing protein n=1 Tax=Aplanochytrium stocchinoi TaxID=215587 RepID=A0A7S3LPY8_9STRA